MRVRPACLKRCNFRPYGLTLVEIIVVLVIVALLVVLTVPTVGYYKRRAEDARCMANLRSLHAALSSYMTDHGQIWPQDPNFGKPGNESLQAKWWYETLKPYGPTRKTWLCPSHTWDAESAEDENNYDFSYIPTMFDDEPNIAYRYNQPWVIEFGGVHDNSMANQVMPDGSLRKQENPAPPMKK